MINVLLATHNQGKVRELSAMLTGAGVNVIGLDAYPELGEIEENGATFAENALIKARAACAATGLISIADDSGLMVDALNGQPGIYSARYGQDWAYLPGENQDQRNIRKLLHIMDGVENRNCSFITVMAAVRPDGREMLAEGCWQGQLLQTPRGENGFGYDPVFFDTILGKTAAELSREEKNSRSHRGNALRELLKKWPDFMR